jgi:condensin complex subunit 1
VTFSSSSDLVSFSPQPKGQISEIALCIIDKHPQIATLATSFFSELAKRQHGEALFNILPDIFSNLVGGGLDKDRQLDEEDFKGIMEFLFKYVSKEKQTESLSEKLCQRFHMAE